MIMYDIYPGEILIFHKPESLYWDNSPNPIHDSRLRSREAKVVRRKKNALPLSHGARISSDGQEAIDKEAEEHLAG